jgi:cardiolipin synthase
VAGAILLVRRGVRVDVRYVGKVATFGLMAGVPLVAWGNFHRPFESVALALGWVSFAHGLSLYVVATALYAGDARRELAARRV